jgi:hypothetical protein
MGVVRCVSLAGLALFFVNHLSLSKVTDQTPSAITKSCKSCQMMERAGLFEVLQSFPVDSEAGDTPGFG